MLNLLVLCAYPTQNRFALLLEMLDLLFLRMSPETGSHFWETCARHQLPLVGVSALAFATGFGFSIGKNV